MTLPLGRQTIPLPGSTSSLLKVKGTTLGCIKAAKGHAIQPPSTFPCAQGKPGQYQTQAAQHRAGRVCQHKRAIRPPPLCLYPLVGRPFRSQAVPAACSRLKAQPLGV
ncbi:hypothetical protein DSO57_1030859 [Entomophthora muscae]|uniref:Uncharacterized protein n=1 Tax=Entomophthora muscae TaxID=34485 RepID=A0ACC2TMU8_9FUNG|nr:hypothetical protein DSO57_1030859 [Entomophthora muscae]